MYRLWRGRVPTSVKNPPPSTSSVPRTQVAAQGRGEARRAESLVPVLGQRSFSSSTRRASCSGTRSDRKRCAPEFSLTSAHHCEQHGGKVQRCIGASRLLYGIGNCPGGRGSMCDYAHYEQTAAARRRGDRRTTMRIHTCRYVAGVLLLHRRVARREIARPDRYGCEGKVPLRHECPHRPRPNGRSGIVRCWGQRRVAEGGHGTGNCPGC